MPEQKVAERSWMVVPEQRGPYTVYRLLHKATGQLEGGAYQTKRDAENEIAFYERTHGDRR